MNLNGHGTSGVRQGSVLCPLFFFFTYINDICLNVSSLLKPFPCDVALYRTIKDDEDYFKLQLDINRVSNWYSDWRMKLNASKSKMVSFSRKNPKNLRKTCAIILTMDTTK